jgi:alpha-1,6-mannosyltransferase
VTDEPHATGPAAEHGHTGSRRIGVNPFRAPPSDEPPIPQSAASGAFAQSRRPAAAGKQAALRYLGLAGSLGVALAGPRPIGLLGVAVLATAWYGLRHVTSLRWLLVTAALWALPLLVTPPLFSGDAMAYACQGQLLVHGLNPYHHGVADLPCSWLDRVPTLWWHTPAPYGPLWVAITGAAAATGELWLAVAVLRLVAVGGIALAVWYGRRFGVNPAWLAAASPLVLLHGVSGAHNDALLAGLVVAGLALALGARWGVVAGVALGLAVAVKVTALVAVPFAVLYVARRRAWAGVAAGVATAFTAVTAATGLGLGWLPALRHTADLIQWTSPPTGVGMAAGYLLRAAGRPDLAPVALAAARAAGLLVLGVVLAALWWRPKPVAAGAALAATALLGPVFFPWYLLPALAVLAATNVRRDRLGPVVAALALLVLPDGTGLASLTKPVGAFLDVALVSAAVVVLVRRYRAGRARPTPTAR